jgi:hypothetical protein
MLTYYYLQVNNFQFVILVRIALEIILELPLNQRQSPLLLANPNNLQYPNAHDFCASRQPSGLLVDHRFSFHVHRV